MSTKSKENKSKAAKAKQKEVTVLCHNAAGKYGLPYSKGAKAKLDAKLADEMIKNKDAE